MNVPSDFVFAAPASAIALEAGALLRDYYSRGVTTEYKSDVDLVTEADRASEKLIVERLHALFPGTESMGKRALAQTSIVNIAGTSIPLTAPRTSLTASPSFAFRWVLSAVHPLWLHHKTAN